MATVPLHAVPEVGSATLLILVTVAAIGTALLVGVAFAALVRRRSRPYLLLVAAFTALLGRSVVAGVSMFGLLSPTTHHLFEHGMDVLLVALVVAAVYYARTVGHEESAVRHTDERGFTSGFEYALFVAATVTLVGCVHTLRDRRTLVWTGPTPPDVEPPRELAEET